MGKESAILPCPSKSNYAVRVSPVETALPALLHRLRGLHDYATSGGVPRLQDRYAKVEEGRGWASLLTLQKLEKP